MLILRSRDMGVKHTGELQTRPIFDLIRDGTIPHMNEDGCLYVFLPISI